MVMSYVITFWIKTYHFSGFTGLIPTGPRNHTDRPMKMVTGCSLHRQGGRNFNGVEY